MVLNGNFSILAVGIGKLKFPVSRYYLSNEYAHLNDYLNH